MKPTETGTYLSDTFPIRMVWNKKTDGHQRLSTWFQNMASGTFKQTTRGWNCMGKIHICSIL